MLLAHDLGTTGDKASLHDDDGALVAAVTETYPTRYDRGGVVEQDPDQWWAAVCRATRRLLASTGTSKGDVRAMALSGQMMGVVLLGADQRPVRPSIIWADTRSHAQCDRLVEAVGEQEAYRTLGHRLNPTYSLSKIMWVRESEPEAFARATSFCLAKDYVVARLTGVVATDPSDASSTNAYDQRAGAWSPQLLAAADLPSSLFPEVTASTTVVGRVRPDAADATGLAAGTPVVMGGGDGPMAAVGAGVIEPADGAYVCLGSSSWVSLSAREPLLDLPAMRTMTFDHVVPGSFVPTATMQAGGAALTWIADLLAGPEDRARFERLVSRAGEVGAAEDDLYFLPHLMGERSPHWNPRARGAFVGLARHHDQAHLTRAVLEGVAFTLATCIEAFRGAGVSVDQVDAIGGGAASDVWLQILADTWGATVRRRSVVEEANSLGAAVTAGVGVGLLDFPVARDLSTVVAVFEPDPGAHEASLARHARFTDAYGHLEPWFDAAPSSAPSRAVTP